MYIPAYFAETDRTVQIDFIRRHGWGYLVGVIDGAPFVTHLPFLVAGAPGAEVLAAHMARANPHWRSFADGAEQLVVFPGPHAYVSPGWYETMPAVPTWNYATVHAYGTPRIVDDPDAVHAGQKRLVDAHEARLEAPWRMEDMDPGYIAGMLRAIVSFEIPVARIEAKFKLSQNRSATDRERVIHALETSAESGARGVAELMRRRAPERAD